MFKHQSLASEFFAPDVNSEQRLELLKHDYYSCHRQVHDAYEEGGVWPALLQLCQALTNSELLRGLIYGLYGALDLPGLACLALLERAVVTPLRFPSRECVQERVSECFGCATVGRTRIGYASVDEIYAYYFMVVQVLAPSQPWGSWAGVGAWHHLLRVAPTEEQKKEKKENATTARLYTLDNVNFELMASEIRSRDLSKRSV